MAIPYSPKEDEDLEDESGKNLGVESAIDSSSKNVAGQQIGSGQFTNLRKYLDSNSSFGDDLSSKVSSAVGDAEKGISNLEKDYKAASDAGKVSLDQKNIDYSVSNPYLATQDKDTLEQFKKQRDAVYSGPNQYTDKDYFEPVRKQTSSAVTDAMATGNESGVKTLLSKYYKNKDHGYTPGEQNLDLLLVSGNKGAQSSFADSQKRARALNPNFQNLENELVNYRTANEKETKQTRNAARSAIGIDEYGDYTGSGPIQGILDAVKKSRIAAEDQYQEQVPLVSTALKRKDISGLSDDLKNKLNLQDVYSLYKVDPEKFLKLQDITNLTDSAVATKDQLRDINSLSELAGLEQNWLDERKVGKFDPENPWSYDKQGLLDAIEVNRQNYITDRNKLAAPLLWGKFSPQKTNMYADIDDMIGLLQRQAGSFTDSDYAPQNLATPASGKYYGPAYLTDTNSAGVVDPTSYVDQLNFYKSMLFGPTGMDDTYGRTDVLKAGRDNEIGEMPEQIKQDIMRGYQTVTPIMYKSIVDAQNKIPEFDKYQAAQTNHYGDKTIDPWTGKSLTSPNHSDATYYMYNTDLNPDSEAKADASKRPGGYDTMPWDEYFRLYSQGKFY